MIRSQIRPSIAGAAIALIQVACGRIDYEAVPPGDFSAPELIAALSDPAAADDDPTVTGDLLELYFESDRLDGRGDILVSVRASPLEPWGPPVVVDELSDPAIDDETPEISIDGLTMIWARNPSIAGPGGSDFYMATRDSRDAPWSAPVLVAELSTPENEGAAAMDASGLRIVLHAVRADGTGAHDLFEARRPSVDDPWSPPQAIAELNTAFDDVTPFLISDGLTLYFASDRPGTVGGQDLYLATRPSLDQPFGPPEPVATLNTAADLQDPWVSPDLRYIVFADNRSGDWELYQARR